MQPIQAKFDDIDEFCHTLEAWDAELYPLSVGMPSRKTDNLLIQYGITNCLYMFCSFGSPLRMFGTPPKGLITFNVMEATQKRYWWRGHDLDAEKVWVFPLNGELCSISPPGFRVHTLSVSEERIARVADDYGIELPPPSQRPEVFSAPGKAMEHILRHFQRMKSWRLPIPHEHVDDLLPLLVSLWLNPTVRIPRHRPSMRARDRAVHKALELIEGCDPSDLTTEFLRDECGASKRTLEYAFHERFGTSPAAFVKGIRLAATKAALLRADQSDRTVTEIAADSGFFHLAQFAADYRRAFRELPSETLRRPCAAR